MTKLHFFCSCTISLSISLLLTRSAYSAPNTPPSTSDYEISSRLNETAELLQAQKTGAAYWEYGWGGFNGASMLWSIAEATHAQDYKSRSTDVVQAVEGLIGVADVVLRPLPAFNANDGCTPPTITEQDRLQCLSVKEALLTLSARRADEPFEFLPHFANFAFNLAAGGIVWSLADARHALTTFIPGMVLGEIQLWTTPQRPIEDLQRYKMQFRPMLLREGYARGPLAGVVFTLAF